MDDTVKNPLTKEVKERWVKALRSGHYKQGKGRLKTVSGYCCLGVLADIQGELSEHGCFDLDNDKILSDSDGRYHYMGQSTQNGVANLNDSGFNFEVIADRIEKYIETVD